MPVTPDLPSSWFETENIHLCTIQDFEKLCEDESISIKHKIFINQNKKEGLLSKIYPNLFKLREFIYLKKNKEILIATSNNGKIKEFENLLAEYKVVSLKDYDIEDAIEDGTSFWKMRL